MTRIKYSKHKNILTTDWYTIGPNFIVRGTIDTSTFQYSVSEFDSGLIRDGQASNLRLAKERIKNILLDSGVKFDGEIRKRG